MVEHVHAAGALGHALLSLHRLCRARYPALQLVEGQHVDYIRTIAFLGPKHPLARL
jgi:hypothetical protein